MAEPGDPSQPGETPGEDHDDDLIGFASPASLKGRAREESLPPPPPAPEPELFDAPVVPVAAANSATPRQAAAEAALFEPSPGFGRNLRRRQEPAPVEGGMGLYAVYALILFAVPSFGASAVIALFAVTGRPGPTEGLSRTHFIYQQRTLWIAVLAFVIGLLLTVAGAPFASGMIILFCMPVWVAVRGAYGVFRLKAGQPIPHPRGWLF